MGEEKRASLDILGIKPIGDAALVLTKAVVDGAGAVLSQICLPAAEEFGGLLKEKIHTWRGAGLIMPRDEGAPPVSSSALRSICGCDDLNRIDIELDRLLEMR